MAGKKAKKNRLKTLEPDDLGKKGLEGTVKAEGDKDLRTYLPGMELAEGEELEVDPSAYVMLHELHAEWPCLSFDNIAGGEEEQLLTFPAEGILVTGTQADRRNRNELYLLRYSNLHKTHVKDEEEEENHDDEEEEQDDDDDDEGDKTYKDPRHYCMAIPHDGAVNRIRSTRLSINGILRTITATWSDVGRVDLWDLTDPLNELSHHDISTLSPLLRCPQIKPLVSIKRHSTEGFALAWSTCQLGRLLTGDCKGLVYLTEINPTGVHTSDLPFKSHQGSVEDLNWSPNEGTVFASAGIDGTVRIWDIRMPRHQSALKATVHSCDVNVISWNRLQNHILASGADDGSFATWDLRTWTTVGDEAATPLMRSSWHRQAVTSIEWNPHDGNVLAVSGADNQLTIWDFSVEEANNDTISDAKVKDDGVVIPTQLLFIHQGQQDIKELHWHPQLSGVLISTAANGFNVFKTISV